MAETLLKDKKYQPLGDDTKSNLFVSDFAKKFLGDPGKELSGSADEISDSLESSKFGFCLMLGKTQKMHSPSVRNSQMLAYWLMLLFETPTQKAKDISQLFGLRRKLVAQWSNPENGV